MIPSFDTEIRDSKRVKPRIQIIEVNHRTQSPNKLIATLLVERVENTHYFYDGKKTSIEYVTLDLVYDYLTDDPRPMGHMRYSFHAKYQAGWSDDATIDLTGGFVVVDPSPIQGNRLGTYLFNEVLTWAKQWPEAVIKPIRLVETDPINKVRRNQFYEKFGIKFDFKDETEQEGYSHPMRVSDLLLVDTWKQNISELNVQELLMKERFRHKQLKLDFDRLNYANKSAWKLVNERDDHPIKYAFTTIYKRHFWPFLAYAVVGILLVLIARNIFIDVVNLF